MEKYWEQTMEEALATIKWITGKDVRNDIRDIEDAIASFKRRPDTTYALAERLDTAKFDWRWACHEKAAHAAK